MSQVEHTHINLPCPAEKLLVHRPPMLLIKELTARENHNATALALISEAGNCVSSDRGILAEYFIEIMAQTVAAAFGYDALINGTPPTEGYIVGIDTCTFNSTPEKWSELVIKTRLEHDLGTVKVLAGEVFSDSEQIIAAELKVWEQEK